jgi:2-polyprenyl-6-methoxyphenol hydroxylase-like FAD-dependent oxidoreductase
MGQVRQGTAVVVGASMAGLVAARVLADHAGAVVVLDRDELPTEPVTRRGVPQGRHAHALLRAGELALADLFPGLVDELVRGGAQRISWLADARWWQFDGYRCRRGEDFEGTFLTRPFLEQTVRDRLTLLRNVTIRTGTRVKGLCVQAGRVTGIEVEDAGIPTTACR